MVAIMFVLSLGVYLFGLKVIRKGNIRKATLIYIISNVIGLVAAVILGSTLIAGLMIVSLMAIFGARTLFLSQRYQQGGRSSDYYLILLLITVFSFGFPLGVVFGFMYATGIL